MEGDRFLILPNQDEAGFEEEEMAACLLLLALLLLVLLLLCCVLLLVFCVQLFCVFLFM